MGRGSGGLLDSPGNYQVKAMYYHFYAGSYAEKGSPGIYRCTYNSEDKSLEARPEIFSVENPSYLAESSDGRFLYAISETENQRGILYAYRICEDGHLVYLNEASCIGMQLCHVAVDSGNHLVSVAGYQSGTIEVFWLQDNGFIGDKVFEDVWKHDSGVCAHAHCTAFHPEMPILLACDLSGWIYGYEVSGKGTISRKFEFALNGYDPRHVLFSKHDKTLCYIICEASNTLLTLRLSEDGAEIIRAVGCCPEDESAFLAAGGIKSNSLGNMLVVSERSLNVSAASNKIVTMRIVDDIPEQYDISGISGLFPRDLKVLENNMIAAACQLSDRIILYRWIDGQMKQLAECRVPKVSCLL